MPLKLLTFNSATSEWINPSDSVLIKIYSSHLFRECLEPLLYLSLPKREIEPVFHLCSLSAYFSQGQTLCSCLATALKLLFSHPINEFILGNSEVYSIKPVPTFRSSAVSSAICFLQMCSSFNVKHHGPHSKL